MWELALHSSDFETIKILVNHEQGINICNDIDRHLIAKYYLALQFSECKKPRYIYYGNSFCQYKLPNLQDLKKVITFCNKEKINFVLVTPPLTSYGVNLCKIYLEYFISIEAKYEIVINDFGMIGLINDMNYQGKIILGRLLDKTIRDYRLSDSEEKSYYNSNGYDYFISLGSTSKSFSSCLIENQIQRIQFDSSQHQFNGNNHFKYDYVFPTEYITTGKLCLFKTTEQQNETRFVMNDHCSKPCMKSIQLLTQPISYPKRDISGERIRNIYAIRCGNTLFHINDTISIVGDFVDRMVFDMDLLSPSNKM